MKRAAILFVAALMGVVLFYGAAYAEDSWKQEFDDICANTENPMVLTKEELKVLIDRCEALKPRIEKLAEAPQKVYLKRLKMCRDLLVFVLDAKMQAK